MSTPEQSGATRRVMAEMTDERWFDIDEDELRRYYGDDVPEDLADAVQQYLWEGEGFPSWLIERSGERDFRSQVDVLGVCPKHGRVMDTKTYDGKEVACGSCWLEGYEAAHQEVTG